MRQISCKLLRFVMIVPRDLEPLVKFSKFVEEKMILCILFCPERAEKNYSLTSIGFPSVLKLFTFKYTN